jgi:hypothetical protein
MTTNDDMAAQLAALEATVADLQDQVTYLFGLHGPARWKHILKQRKDNAPKPLPTLQHQSHGVPNKSLAT